METGLKGKKVLVTGSTLGIGKAIAEAFIKEQSKVIIHGRHEEKIQTVVDEFRKKYPEAEICGVAADVGTTEGANMLYDTVTKDGPLDILINNVGVYGTIPFTEISDEKWFDTFNINIMSIVRLCRRALPDMLKRNSGKIINIGSDSAIRVNPDMTHYSTTKGANMTLTRCLAEMTKGTNVRVNSVLPAATMTDGLLRYMQKIADDSHMTLEEANKEYFTHGTDSTSLIQRFLKPEEVAMTVIFAAANDGISGNNILIDAGTIKHT